MGGFGARKVALFLSLLEPSTVETLMGLFDPEVARKVAREARNINPDELYYDESLITDFREAFGEDALGVEATRLIAEEARRNAQRYDLASDSDLQSEEEGRDFEEEPGERASELELVSPELLNDALKGERFAVRAAVAARLSRGARRRFMEGWTREEREKALLYAETLDEVSNDSQNGVKRLEDVLFERAFDYE